MPVDNATYPAHSLPEVIYRMYPPSLTCIVAIAFHQVRHTERMLHARATDPSPVRPVSNGTCSITDSIVREERAGIAKRKTSRRHSDLTVHRLLCLRQPPHAQLVGVSPYLHVVGVG